MPHRPPRPSSHDNTNSNSHHYSLRRRVIVSLFLLCLSYAKSAATTTAVPAESADHHAAAAAAAADPPNCTSPAIEEFPRDIISPEQRNKGGVVIHIIIAAYLVWTLGIICDDYFVPALEIICEKLHLKPDVAGATFMAAGTSSPEFFANVMGTFITESDLGIGTIVGSAVFNIFGVIAVCGLFTGNKVPLDWYPITRDCFFYGITIIVLIVVLIDERVFWYESVVMMVCYTIYIVVMYFNQRIEKWSHKTHKRVKSKIFPASANEASPLRAGASYAVTDATAVTAAAAQSPVRDVVATNGVRSNEKDLEGPADDSTLAEGVLDEEEKQAHEFRYPWKKPKGVGIFGTFWWLLFFPANLIFFLTIPDVRMGPKCGRFYMVSFVLCICWIGALCYVATWMITVIGFTFSIPDSVMGLSFLAVGTSIPEVISSLIVSRQGHGSMAVSNSIGSNTFDILVCLGLPWLIKSIMSGTSEQVWYITVNSQGLGYTVATLLLSLAILYVALLISKFTLSKTLGVICGLIYAIFLVFSILVELNVFYDVNLPMCPSSF